MTPPVVVVGDLMVDVVAAASQPIARASDADARVAWGGGGAAANTAAWLARLGTPVALVTRVGADVAGRGAVAELRDGGVDVRAVFDAARPTGTCVVVVEPGGERTMLPDRGANDGLAPDDLPSELFVPGAHLHLSGYTLLHPGSRPAGLASLARAREAGMTVSVDPASAAPLRACPAFLRWVADVDTLLPNEDELAALGGDAFALAREVGEVVVKRGMAGAVWTDGTDVVQSRAVPVHIVDTTGAGDAFAAGWIAARTGGATVADALRAGCSCGARAVARTGARPDIPG